MKRYDLTGRIINRWFVIAKDGRNKHGDTMYLCRCQCGTVRRVLGTLINKGRSKSCGCFAREVSSKVHFKHGQWQSSEYNTWQAMKNRCLTPTAKDYPRYGGRGITICSQWIDDFEQFLHDMGPKPPGDNISIERKNNSLGYFPENCIWATAHTQSRNKRSNRIIEWNGIKYTITDFAEFLGIPKQTVYARYYAGWSVDEIVNNRRADGKYDYSNR